jgi:hypothetical protein
MSSKGTKIPVGSIEEQRELFLWKYRDILRADVNVLFNDFKKHDLTHRGELDEHEASMLLEHRGEVRTATELREMIAGMDADKNHRLSFVEFCCAYFHKSFDNLNTYVDEDARAACLAEAMKFGEEAKKAEEAIAEAAREKEEEATARAAKIEEEGKMSGVAGMRAFFARQAESTKDSTKSNKDVIQEEFQRRKALKEAKAKMNAAIEGVNKVKTAEEIAAECELAAKKTAEAEAAAIKKAAEDEKAARAARKAMLNAKWGSNMNIKDAMEDEIKKVAVKRASFSGKWKGK